MGGHGRKVDGWADGIRSRGVKDRLTTRQCRGKRLGRLTFEAVFELKTNRGLAFSCHC